MSVARDPAPIAIDGRALGSRGTRTRRRLLEATAGLLETHGIRDLRVVDIARRVETSPATFYQYFRDVEDAVLALASEVGESTGPLRAVLAGSWDADGALDSARALVEGFVDFWDVNRAVLRTRNLAAQEGDQRFRDVRNRAGAVHRGAGRARPRRTAGGEGRARVVPRGRGRRARRAARAHGCVPPRSRAPRHRPGPARRDHRPHHPPDRRGRLSTFRHRRSDVRNV